MQNISNLQPGGISFSGVDSDGCVRSGIKGGQIPLTGFDVLNRHQFSWHTYLFKKCPDVDVLISSLRRALIQVPVFGGRMRSRPDEDLYIDCSDAGVPFTVKDVDVPMPSFGMHRSVDVEVNRYIAKRPLDIVDKNEALFRVQLTRFSCGGGILGLCWPHSLVDGTGYMAFVTRWARYARGDTPLPDPELDRRKCLALAEGPGLEPSEFSTLVSLKTLPFLKFIVNAVVRSLFATSHYAFRVEPDQLSALKERYLELMNADDWVSTSDLLCAVMWKRIAQIQIASGKTTLGAVRNIRGMDGINLPESYIGNALMMAVADYDFSSVKSDSVLDVARAIRKSTQRITADMVKQELAYMTRKIRDKTTKFSSRGVMGAHGNGVLCNNLSRFPIHELDFGTGKPFWVDGPSRRMALRYFALFPTGDNDGSLIVHLILSHAEMSRFKAAYGSAHSIENSFLLT